jgi:hypothetical protein
MITNLNPELYINKIILYEGDLITIDAIDDGFIYYSKLESDSELESASICWLESDKFDFEVARIQAVNIMNQTRYFDNKIKKETGNPVS